MQRLAIVTTHPIQYYAPLFKLLATKCDLMVFYTWGEQSLRKFDPGFGQIIEWDVPLLDGYNFKFLKNVSTDEGSHHFRGIRNPDAIKQIKNFEPEVVMVFGWAYQSHLNIMRYFKGRIPVWFRGDSTLLDEVPGWRSIIKKLFLRWVYNHVDKAFYVGQNNKAYFKKYGLKEENLIFAPHAIDNNRFAKERSEEANTFRKSLGLSAHDKLVLFAGKLETKKNPLLFLQAFLNIQPVDAHLLFVGNGPLEQELTTKVQHEKNRNVHFMDFQNQSRMPVIYQCCDVFCLPSQGPGETWGLAVNEAMASGKAVLVSSKVGCAIDLVHNEDNGYIFLSNDITDFQNKLDNLLNSDLKIKGLKSSKIIKSWSFGNTVNAIIQELEYEGG